MMRTKKLFAMTVLLFSCAILKAQYSSSDFTITTEGLSEEYAARFKDESKKEVLANIFNQLKVTHDVSPIKIKVIYENGEGYVLAELNYDHDKVFSSYSDYSSHNNSWNRYGTGISLWLQNQICTALGQYKKSVATKGYMIDKDITKFESVVKLKKTNGDWILFYAYNYFDSRGFYPYKFYKNVHMQVDGKKYETETSNTKMLNEMKYFFVGKTTGLDGNKTGAYYFCNFFNIETK